MDEREFGTDTYGMDDYGDRDMFDDPWDDDDGTDSYGGMGGGGGGSGSHRRRASGHGRAAAADGGGDCCDVASSSGGGALDPTEDIGEGLGCATIRAAIATLPEGYSALTIASTVVDELRAASGIVVFKFPDIPEEDWISYMDPYGPDRPPWVPRDAFALMTGVHTDFYQGITHSVVVNLRTILRPIEVAMLIARKNGQPPPRWSEAVEERFAILGVFLSGTRSMMCSDESLPVLHVRCFHINWRFFLLVVLQVDDVEWSVRLREDAADTAAASRRPPVPPHHPPPPKRHASCGSGGSCPCTSAASSASSTVASTGAGDDNESADSTPPPPPPFPSPTLGLCGILGYHYFALDESIAYATGCR